MKISVKADNKIWGHCAIINKTTVEVSASLRDFLDGIKRVEISNKPFPGCTKKDLTPITVEYIREHPYINTAGMFIDNVWICNEWITKLGLKKHAYVKIRK
jgi:hypothetical protein